MTLTGWLLAVGIAGVFALAPAEIARRKGYDFTTWWLLGLLAWQWTANANAELAHELGHAMSEGFTRAVPILLWMLPALVLAAFAYFLPRSFGEVRVESLRDALLGRIAARDRRVGG